MASIQQLRSRIGQIKQELVELEKQLIEARMHEAGLRPGDLVREKQQGSCRRGRFVQMNNYHSAWIRARVFKKDGTLGREVTFYEWERVEDAEAA